MKKSLSVLSAIIFIMAAIAFAAPGSWVQIGEAGSWKNTIAGVGMGDKIYTVESGGNLYETDSSTGRWRQLGGAEYSNTQFVFDGSGFIMTIEANGNLYKISTSDGAWTQLGQAGDWSDTIAGVLLKDMLYTIESSGKLYATNPPPASGRQSAAPILRQQNFYSSAAGCFTRSSQAEIFTQ